MRTLRRGLLASTALVIPPVVAVTWSPTDKATELVLSNGNLTVTGYNPADLYGVRATTYQSSGKHYFEIYINNDEISGDGSDDGGGYSVIGIDSGHIDLEHDGPGEAFGLHPGDHTYAGFGFGHKYGYTYQYGYSGGGTYTSATTGMTVGFAVDLVNNKLWISVNGVWQYGDPATNTTACSATLDAVPYTPCVGVSSGIFSGKFTTASFAHAPPTGFSPWQADAAVVVTPPASAVSNKWRFYPLTNDTTDVFTVVEMGLYQATGPDLAHQPGVPSSNDESAGQAQWAFDNSSGSYSYWGSGSNPPVGSPGSPPSGALYLRYSFINPQSINEISLTPRSDALYQTPTDVLVQYYNGTSWVTAWEASFSAWTMAAAQRSTYPSYSTAALPTSTQWQIVMVYGNIGGDRYTIYDLGLYSTPGDTHSATSPRAYSASSEGQGSAVFAFDNNNSSYWSPTTKINEWIEIDFLYPVAITGISLTSRNDSFCNQTPTSGIVKYFDGTSWITAWKATFGVWTQNQTQRSNTPAGGVVSAASIWGSDLQAGFDASRTDLVTKDGTTGRIVSMASVVGARVMDSVVAQAPTLETNSLKGLPGLVFDAARSSYMAITAAGDMGSSLPNYPQIDYSVAGVAVFSNAAGPPNVISFGILGYANLITVGSSAAGIVTTQGSSNADTHAASTSALSAFAYVFSVHQSGGGCSRTLYLSSGHARETVTQGDYGESFYTASQTAAIGTIGFYDGSARGCMSGKIYEAHFIGRGVSNAEAAAYLDSADAKWLS